MKVLLIYLTPPAAVWPQGRFLSHWVPSGVAQIATQLRAAGHAVRVIVRDEQLARLGFDWAAANRRLVEQLEAFRPDVVGLSVVTPAMSECRTISGMIKATGGPDVRVVAGGPHPTALPEQTLDECPDVDLAAIGEGEATLVELAGGAPPETIAGLAFRRDGGVVRTAPRRPQRDLDAFEPLAYDLFDMDHYTAPTPWMIRWRTYRAMNLRTSRGCPGRCRFCAGHVTAGVGVRFRAIDAVLERIRWAVDTYGVEAILFEDDTLGANADRLRALCDGLRREGLDKRIVWSGCLRVEQAEPDLLKTMRDAGCIQIEYGFESGSDRMLRAMSKNASVELNRRAVRLTREVGIRIFGDVLVGLPGETTEDFDATVAFVRWARVDVLGVAMLYPLPGTPIYDDLTDAQKRLAHWDGYAYPQRPGFLVNLTAMDDATYTRRYERFMRYLVRPAIDRQVLRDSPTADLRRRVRRFARRHPIRATRLPL
ncbi:MAG: B12-binding domain-containing radical SAM protein [Planctomycetota bacterium]